MRLPVFESTLSTQFATWPVPLTCLRVWSDRDSFLETARLRPIKGAKCGRQKGGDDHGYSDALLGVFDPIAPAAATALAALAAGDRGQFDAVLAPTVPLSRHMFRAPTRFYKTGVVFLAWLNGHQDHFVMVGGQQSARSLLHLTELFELADAAGLLRDPELACARMRTLLAMHGFAG